MSIYARNFQKNSIVTYNNKLLKESYGYKFRAESNVRPDIYWLTNTVRHLTPSHEQFFTEAFYTLALQQINKRYYSTPSHYVGQYGTYEALRYAFENGGLNHLVKDNSILISRLYSLEDIENAREHISDNFRSKYDISKNDTVVFFAPGDTLGENVYTLEEFRKGFNEFIYKYSAPTSLSPNAPKSSAFKLIVSLHKGTESEKYVRDFIEGSEYASQVIIVTNENNEHYAAICASDFGFVYNGQMLSAAAALHLNVITMQDMNDLHYYWHTWENRWLAEVNIYADRPAIPEFAAGEFWFGKIANKLGEMHTNTDLKWDQIRTLKPFISGLLPIKEIVRNKSDPRDIIHISNDPTIYDEYEDPIHLMASKIASSMSSYKNPIALSPNIDIVNSIPSIKLNNSLSAGL